MYSKHTRLLICIFLDLDEREYLRMLRSFRPAQRKLVVTGLLIQAARGITWPS